MTEIPRLCTIGRSSGDSDFLPLGLSTIPLKLAERSISRIRPKRARRRPVQRFASHCAKSHIRSLTGNLPPSPLPRLFPSRDRGLPPPLRAPLEPFLLPMPRATRPRARRDFLERQPGNGEAAGRRGKGDHTRHRPRRAPLPPSHKSNFVIRSKSYMDTSTGIFLGPLDHIIFIFQLAVAGASSRRGPVYYTQPQRRDRAFAVCPSCTIGISRMFSTDAESAAR